MDHRLQRVACFTVSVTKYGYPPEPGICEQAPAPEGLSVRTDQRLLHSVVQTGMVPHGLNRKASAQAVARQLQLHYEDDLPVAVKVPGYGTFRIGREGWCLE